jgi:hypothetical protein
MLMGYDRKLLMEQVQQKFGKPWKDMWGHRNRRLANYHELQFALTNFVIRTTKAPLYVGEAATFDYRFSRGRVPCPLIPKGRGMLILVKKVRSRKFGHAVAFENGKVYDPSSGVFDPQEFSVHYRTWRIQKVVRVNVPAPVPVQDNDLLALLLNAPV